MIWRDSTCRDEPNDPNHPALTCSGCGEQGELYDGNTITISGFQIQTYGEWIGFWRDANLIEQSYYPIPTQYPYITFPSNSFCVQPRQEQLHEFFHMIFADCFEGNFHEYEDPLTGSDDYNKTDVPYYTYAQTAPDYYLTPNSHNEPATCQGAISDNYGLMFTRPNLCIWERMKLGWITPRIVTTADIGTTFTLKEFSDRNADPSDIAIEIPIPGTTPPAYYLLENHQSHYLGQDQNWSNQYRDPLDMMGNAATSNVRNVHGNFPGASKDVAGIWVQKATDDYIIRCMEAGGLWDWQAGSYKYTLFDSPPGCWGHPPNWYQQIMYSRYKSDSLYGKSDGDVIQVGQNGPYAQGSFYAVYSNWNGLPCCTTEYTADPNNPNNYISAQVPSLNFQHPPRDFDANPNDNIAGLDPITGQPACGWNSSGNTDYPFGEPSDGISGANGMIHTLFTDYTNPAIMDSNNDPNNQGIGFVITGQVGDDVYVKIISAKNPDNTIPLAQVQNVQAAMNTSGCGISVTWDQSLQDNNTTNPISYNVYRSINGGTDELLTTSPMTFGTYIDNTISNISLTDGLNYVNYSVVAIATTNGIFVGYPVAPESDYSESVGILYGDYNENTYYNGNTLLIVGSPLIETGASLTLANAPTFVRFCNNNAVLTIYGTLTIDNKDFNQGSAILNGALDFNGFFQIGQGSTFNIAENAEINLNCNITIENYSTWNIGDGAVVGLNVANNYIVQTTSNFNINGLQSNIATINSINGSGVTINFFGANTIELLYATLNNTYMQCSNWVNSSNPPTTNIDVENCTFNSNIWINSPTCINIFNPTAVKNITIYNNTFYGQNSSTQYP